MELFHDVRLDAGGFTDHVSICYSEPEDSYAVIHPTFRKNMALNIGPIRLNTILLFLQRLCENNLG